MSWPITADDVRNELAQSPTSSRVQDDDLASIAESAMSKVENVIGQHRGQTLRAAIHVRRRVDEVVLPHKAASVTSVWLDGVEVVGATFDPDESERVVQVPSIGPGRVVVAYVAPTTVPADVESATIVLAAHEWLQRRPGMGGAGDGANPMGYAWPNRVVQVLAPHAEVGGLA